jgi:hypothetical protein
VHCDSASEGVLKLPMPSMPVMSSISLMPPMLRGTRHGLDLARRDRTLRLLIREPAGTR